MECKTWSQYTRVYSQCHLISHFYRKDPWAGPHGLEKSALGLAAPPTLRWAQLRQLTTVVTRHSGIWSCSIWHTEVRTRFICMVSTQLPDTFRCFYSNYRSSISTRRIPSCLLIFWSGRIGLWSEMNIYLCLNKTMCFFVDIKKYFEQATVADFRHVPNRGTDIGHLPGHIHRVIGSPYISCKKSYLFCSFFQ